MIRQASLAGACALAFAATAGAQSFDYPDFTNLGGLVLNGDAAQAGNALRLTTTVISQKGSVWYENPVEVASGFDMTAEFRFTDQFMLGGDGMAFVIQNDPDGTAALTVHASAMGYGRFTSSPPDTGLLNSVAFELDTYENGNWGDTNDNHVSVHTNADGENTQDEVLSLGEAQPADMSDGTVHTLRVVYVPGLLEVFVDDLVNPLLSINYDFVTGGNWSNGNPVGGIDMIGGSMAYVGFTASNGGAWENHDLISWEWNSGGGTLVCFGDGSGNACPCGNEGTSGQGCANSSGAGALLLPSGTPSISNDTLVLTATGVLPGQPGLFFQGDTAINGGLGQIFGDGLRCCGTNVIRLSTIAPGAGGCAASDASCGTDLMAPLPAGPISQHPSNSLVPGDTRCYQFWYRDPLPMAPCGSTFNLTNAVQVTWEM